MANITKFVILCNVTLARFDLMNWDLGLGVLLCTI